MRDVNIPPELRTRIKIPENPYDSLMFKNGYLLPTELKSTKGKSLPFKNIKQHQIDSLIESNTYNESIIPGFLVNFSDLDISFFIHIESFVEYQKLGANGNTKINGIKINEKSLSLDYCEAHGIELVGVKKRVKMRWYVGDLISKIIDEYKIGK